VDLLGQEVIVVLGAAVREGGEASPALRRRVFHAIELARERPDSLLLFTGGVGIFPPAEAEVMARLARRAGIARERMLLEDQATTTAQSARLCASLIERLPAASTVIVTDAYHQRRARLAFRRMGLARVSSSPVPPSELEGRGLRSLRQSSRRQLRELVGLLWYSLRLWR